MPPVVQEIAYGEVTNGGTTNPLSITIPAGTTAGELLLAICITENASTRKFNTPAGWSLEDETVSSAGIQIFARRAQAGDASSTVNFTPATTFTNGSMAMLRISGDGATIGSLAVVVALDTDAGGSADAPDVTVPANDSLLLRVAGRGQATPTYSSPPGGYSAVVNMTFATATARLDVYSITAAAGSAGTASMTSSFGGSNPICVASIAIEPAAGGNSHYYRQQEALAL